MKTTALFYACVLAGTLAQAETTYTTTTTTTDSAKYVKPTDNNVTINNSKIKALDGAQASDERRVRTAGRAEDPNTGMASPNQGNPVAVKDMNDFRYSPTVGVRPYREGTLDLQANQTVRRRPVVSETVDTYQTVTLPGDSMDSTIPAARPAVSNRATPTGTTSAYDSTAPVVAPTVMTTTDGNYRATQGVTADQQPRNRRDVAITREIRRGLMRNKDLSTRAHNLTIVTDGGRVYLRGTVPNAEEKSSVEEIARGVSGVSSVNNQVTVSR